MKALFATVLCLPLCFSHPASAEPSPASMISGFRAKQGEGSVVIDATLNRIALDQARAMAARDKLDHDVLGPFNSRMAPAKAGRAAENIAYGHEDFARTLDQWINSAGHRKNLLLPKASRVGVASAKSATSRRTYWAMVIAGDYEAPRPAAARKAVATTESRKPGQSCRMTVLGICF
ncbi:MAG: CAP domain-containing protein [Bradyrhizobium sp.]|uniref:CAP domain-containing protein n=1 Tax=Bradyrhizobium sp. TaxID=376 RepID=UPI002731C323|nr:CAP domain-containing protein [Bradyrhizobium sp.]MDP1866276.1 CAP domain-containing protein [Bradyrhizobium sp.]